MKSSMTSLMQSVQREESLELDATPTKEQEMPYGASHESFDVDGIIAAGLRAFKRVVHLVRQSTNVQVKRSLGSRADQLNQIRFLRPFGIDHGHELVTLLDAEKGDRATRKVRKDGTLTERETFEQLIELLETNDYFLVVIYSLSRVARDIEDATRFMGVLRRTGAKLLVNGRILDMADKHDADRIVRDLLRAAADAEARSEDSQVGRLEVAKMKSLIYSLPSGIVRADPLDPVFAKRMEECGLAERIRPEALAAHTAKKVDKEGRILYALPLPDPEVRAAQGCMVRWALEETSANSLIKRICRGGDGWPAGKEGMIPLTRETTWRASSTMSWSPATTSRLRNWFDSPAIYGVYSYRASGLEKLRPKDKGKECFHIIEHEAFPGLLPESSWRIIERLFSKPDQHYRTENGKPRPRGYEGARIHALVNVECGGTDTGCGKRGGQWHANDGSYLYRFVECERDHDCTMSVSPVVEGAVLRALEEVISNDFIAAGLNQLTVIDNSVRTQIADLQSQRDLARAKFLNACENANIVGATNASLREAYLELSATAHAAVASLESGIRQLEQRSKASLDLEEEERQLIFAAASNFSRTLRLACEMDRTTRARMYSALASGDTAMLEQWRAHEGQVRRIVRATGVIVRMRPAEDGERTEVVVQFPGGATRRSLVDAVYRAGPQAERAWITRQLRQGVSEDVIALELTRVGALRTRPRGRTWNSSMVRAAQEYHANYEHVAAPSAEEAATALEAVVSLAGLSDAAVREALLLGKLGRARLDGDGNLFVEGDEKDQMRVFPDYARLEAAVRRGWDVEDTAAVVELCQTDLGKRGGHQKERTCAFHAFIADLLDVDAAGNQWTRRSRQFPKREDAARYRLAHTPQYSAMDASCWKSLKEFYEAYPGVDYNVMRRYTPQANIQGGASGHIAMFWIGPEQQVRFGRPTLEQAVAQLIEVSGRAYCLEDFIMVARLNDRITEDGYKIHATLIRKAIAKGHITTVRALPLTNRGGWRQWLYMPVELQQRPTAATMRAWLKGMVTHPPMVKR
ncbi:MAG: recombinase family protein [Gemmatimonadota bacterium]